jgi:hypothetical protein
MELIRPIECHRGTEVESWTGNGPISELLMDAHCCHRGCGAVQGEQMRILTMCNAPIKGTPYSAGI